MTAARIAAALFGAFGLEAPGARTLPPPADPGRFPIFSPAPARPTPPLDVSRLVAGGTLTMMTRR